MQVKSCVQQVWQAGPRQATTDVVGMSSIMASSSRGGEDFAACMLGAVDLPISIPLERWEVDSGTGASAEVVQSNMLRFAALADGVDSFDAAAFRLAPAEAAAMDPQQRILLEQTYGALQVQLYSISPSLCNFWSSLCTFTPIQSPLALHTAGTRHFYRGH